LKFNQVDASTNSSPACFRNKAVSNLAYRTRQAFAVDNRRGTTVVLTTRNLFGRSQALLMIRYITILKEMGSSKNNSGIMK